MAKSTVRKIALSLLPLAVIMGMLAYGGFELGRHNPGQSTAAAQDTLFTGRGWLVKPFSALKFNNFDALFDPVNARDECVVYSNAGRRATVTVIQFGDGITHAYDSPTQIRVCGNIVHLPPSIVRPTLDTDDDE